MKTMKGLSNTQNPKNATLISNYSLNTNISKANCLDTNITLKVVSPLAHEQTGPWGVGLQTWEQPPFRTLQTSQRDNGNKLTKHKARTRQRNQVGLPRISCQLDIWPFLIFGIRPDIRQQHRRNCRFSKHCQLYCFNLKN